jgi:hypothetical protein
MPGCRARSIIVRSTSSTADGLQRDDAYIPLPDGGRKITPSARMVGTARADRERRVHASVPLLPTSRCAKLTLPSAV